MGVDPWVTDLVNRGKASLLVELRMEKATREALMSVRHTFGAVGQILNATKMDLDGLIDTRFVKRA